MKDFFENFTIKEYKALETLANVDCREVNCKDCPFCYKREDNTTRCMSLHFSALLREIDKREV